MPCRSTREDSQELLRTTRAGTHLLRSDRALVRLAELLDDTGVTSQILLASHKDDGKPGTEMHNLGNPLKEADKTSA